MSPELTREFGPCLPPIRGSFHHRKLTPLRDLGKLLGAYLEQKIDRGHDPRGPPSTWSFWTLRAPPEERGAAGPGPSYGPPGAGRTGAEQCCSHTLGNQSSKLRQGSRQALGVLYLRSILEVRKLVRGAAGEEQPRKHSISTSLLVLQPESSSKSHTAVHRACVRGGRQMARAAPA